MAPLRQRMIEDLQLRNRTPRTIQCYVGHVRRFAAHFGRSPEQLGPEDVLAYQLHLLSQRVSWSAFNQCVSALGFLYDVTLGRREPFERLAYGRRPKRIPRVLSREEVRGLLTCTPRWLPGVVMIDGGRGRNDLAADGQRNHAYDPSYRNFSCGTALRSRWTVLPGANSQHALRSLLPLVSTPSRPVQSSSAGVRVSKQRSYCSAGPFN